MDGAADQMAIATVNLPICLGHMPIGRNMQVDGRGKVHVVGNGPRSAVDVKSNLANMSASHVQRRTNWAVSKPNLNGGIGGHLDTIADVPMMAITLVDVKELKA